MTGENNLSRLVTATGKTETVEEELGVEDKREVSSALSKVQTPAMAPNNKVSKTQRRKVKSELDKMEDFKDEEA